MLKHKGGKALRLGSIYRVAKLECAASHGGVLRATSVLVACVFLLASCGETSKTWTEEVYLENGDIIIAERAGHGKSLRQLGGPSSWFPREMSISIRPRGPTPIPPEWRGPFDPVLLDYQPASNAWSIVTTFRTCEAWYAEGRPIPPYIQYRSVGGAPWQQVALESEFIGRETNMVTGPWSEDEGSTLTIAVKNSRRELISLKNRRILSAWGRDEYNNCALK